MLKKLLGFGLPIEDWRSIRYATLRGIGRIEADHFHPAAWNSRVPNAAYLRAQPDDTFWAARKVMAVTDGMVAAAVKSGRYTDPKAEQYLIWTLIARRNAIGWAYLTSINPVVDFALDDAGLLTWHNVAVEYDLANAPVSYRITWSRFDNATGETTPLGAVTETRASAAPAPSSLPRDPGASVQVDISAKAPTHPSWGNPVRAYFRRTTSGWTLVGLEREGAKPIALAAASDVGQQSSKAQQ